VIIGTALAAKEMGGYTTSGVIYHIKKLQERHPEIEIILPRAAFGRWRFRLEGIRLAVNLERNSTQMDLIQRIELLEADMSLLRMLVGAKKK
jgi:hypothetical protein